MNIIKNQKGLNLVGQGGKIILFTLPFVFILILVHQYFPEFASLPGNIGFIKPVGYIFLIPGIILWVTGVIQLLIEFPKGKLITTGAYSIVRNPIYSSFCFFILPAITLLTLTWVYLVISFTLYIGVIIFIKKEEEQLKETFGSNYEDYYSEVDRMIPFNIFKTSKNMKERITRHLLTFGILATAFYLASDFICSFSYQGYSYYDQAISELSAIGSPTTSLWKTLTILFSPLVILFGIGVALLSGKKLSLKITGFLLVLWGISGYAWLFFPMNMRGNIGSVSDTGHLILSGITVLLLVAIIAFGSGVAGKKFRVYSFITIAFMIFFGFLTGSTAPLVAANEPTPWMGIYERISVFTPMIWMSILATILLKTSNDKRLKNE